ncbi:hypothetical protein MANES_12G067150v8 [Manihot esculenta]|uniref:Uncharacterized protein n=1 Tax=Manihot esculenta TaxID=3983 RepID=A0ACB7GPD6_MANES|nr:hypothetical protein MANES_12G067150v8 [Manihot esculenta]
MKARYFPSSSLWTVSLGHNPSYVWRSIWESWLLILSIPLGRSWVSNCISWNLERDGEFYVKSAYKLQSTAATPSLDHLRSWQRPPEGWMKVNVDVSTDPSMSFMGLGAVVRDSYGKFVAAKAWRYPGFF